MHHSTRRSFRFVKETESIHIEERVKEEPCGNAPSVGGRVKGESLFVVVGVQPACCRKNLPAYRPYSKMR